MHHQFNSCIMIARTALQLLALVAVAQSAKILGVFPYPSKSHHILASALLKELAKRGHDVTMVSPFPLNSPLQNYTDIQVDSMMQRKNENMKQFMNPNTTVLEKVYAGINAINRMGRMLLENENLQRLLQSGNEFDLVIQMYGMNEAMLGIGHRLNASTIGFSVVGTSFMINYITANPSPYSYVPNLFLSYTDNMSFFERVFNSMTNIFFDLILHYINMPTQKSLLKEFFPDAPELSELIENSDITLVNSHFITETPRPYLPNIIQIGGFHLQEKEDLPNELKQYLDASKHGVVLFSLGSNIRSEDVAQDTINVILGTFRKSKYDILWKFEGDLIGKPDNVRIAKWLPQRAVLAHPKIKAFITHGGLGSTVEAIYYGVPMICMPVFGDQMKNSADSERNGYGIVLDYTQLNEETFSAALRDITENPMYSKNVQIRSDLYRNQEINPMDKAIYWINHVLKHGHAKHLKSRAHLIPWYQYMLLDVICFLIAVIVIFIGALYFVFKMIAKLCCGRQQQLQAKLKKH